MDASNPGTPAYFASDYFAARHTFLTRAHACGARIVTYPIGARGPGDRELAIDSAYLGAEQPRRLLVVLSGTHGVEGFAGSALQSQWLDRADTAVLPADGGCLLIHAVNPYGFAWWRRVNEHNVDLNRNALDRFPGPPNRAYANLDGWLNPKTPPLAVDLFWPRGVWRLATRGLAPLRQAIVRGQYEFPRGLFFGGERREESTAHLERIVGAKEFRDAECVIVIDLHTGLGPSATYHLRIDVPEDTPAFRDLARWFGADVVGSSQQHGSAVYEVSGGIVEMIERRVAPARARVAVVEIGTVPLAQMLYRLYRENRATFYAPPQSRVLTREREALREAFCPSDPRWRRRVLAHGNRVFEQALQALRDG
jgi:Protein of unknown function (DUF2817)